LIIDTTIYYCHYAIISIFRLCHYADCHCAITFVFAAIAAADAIIIDYFRHAITPLR